MKRKITSLTAGAALIGSIGSFSVSADPGNTKTDKTNKSEEKKTDLENLLNKNAGKQPLLNIKGKQKNVKKSSKMGLFPLTGKPTHKWKIAEEYKREENNFIEKQENTNAKENGGQEYAEEKDLEIEKNTSELNKEKTIPDEKIERAEADNTKAKENKSGRFYKFMSVAAGVAKGVWNKIDYAVGKVTCGFVNLTGIATKALDVADFIATNFTGAKTTSEKIGGMAGVVGGQYISGAICAAVGVSVSMPLITTVGAISAVSSTPTVYSAISSYTNKYIAAAACTALVAGCVGLTAFNLFTYGLSVFGLAAIASTVATSVIYSITDKITIGTGKYIGGRIGNFFSNSPKVEEKKDINTPPNSP